MSSYTLVRRKEKHPAEVVDQADRDIHRAIRVYVRP